MESWIVFIVFVIGIGVVSRTSGKEAAVKEIVDNGWFCVDQSVKAVKFKKCYVLVSK